VVPHILNTHNVCIVSETTHSGTGSHIPKDMNIFTTLFTS